MNDRSPPDKPDDVFEFDDFELTVDRQTVALLDDDDGMRIGLVSAETPEPARVRGAPSDVQNRLSSNAEAAWSLPPEVEGSMRGRAAWLEEEAKLQKDISTGARIRTSVSEIYAIVGERAKAAAAARDAYNVSSKSSLVQRQWRGLLDHTAGDLAAEIEALDVETKVAPTSAARVHAALVAAELLRKHGDEEGASKHWEQVIRLAPNDPRAPLARITRSLTRDETGALALRVPDVNELTPIASAIGVMLRLRGIDRKSPFDDGTAVVDALGRARVALMKGDPLSAAGHFATLEAIPELSRAALWLGSALGGRHASTRPRAGEGLQRLVDDGIDSARPPLAAHGLELNDAGLVRAAVEGSDAFTLEERIAIYMLAGRGDWIGEGQLSLLATIPGMRPLVASIDPFEGEQDSPTRLPTTFARQLARGGRPKVLKELTDEFQRIEPGAGHLFSLEMAYQRGDTAAIALGLMEWKEVDEHDAPQGARDRAFAGAFVHELAGDPDTALVFYAKALALDATCPAARGAVARLDPSFDVRRALRTAAEIIGPGLRGAFTWLEADARSLQTSDRARELLLENAHRAAPSLPFAAYLATERARYEGRIDHALTWIRHRREGLTDPLELAIDLAREAFWTRGRDADGARDRLAEAHRLRPSDIALRLFLEGHDPNFPNFAQWRETRAASLTGVLRAHFLLEAAYAYEITGDAPGFLRTAQTATQDARTELSRVILERAEMRTGSTTRLAEELIEASKAARDATERREAYERLAELDLYGRRDAASALLWHRAIVDEFPSHKPSLRYLEHILTGEGRVEELVPIAVSIAKALRKSNDVESTSHAQFVIQTHLASATPQSNEVRAILELTAADPAPPVSIVHARRTLAILNNDERAILDALHILIKQAKEPYEIAALSVHAGESAQALRDFNQSRSILERATQQDADDVFAWKLLAQSLGQGGDTGTAALAYENLARVSAVAAHQLEAWYEAGRIWQDFLHDTRRAVLALEQAAELDLLYLDIFPRLASLYREQAQLAALASLFERRLPGVVDPDERVAMAIEWSRVLMTIGSLTTARMALEEALLARPDHPIALNEYAQLSEMLTDWESAEETWVRLARLLTDPSDQKMVYSRLGELYATHASNPARAEVAFLEVLKRDPDSEPTIERLVAIYIQQNNLSRVIEMQHKLVQLARTTDEQRHRLIELSAYHENLGHDPRKAEQALETARREFPTDALVLRALVDLYVRHKQLPAIQIVLDRTSADVRRAFAAGKFTAPLFDIMATAYDLRGRKDAARVALASRDAFEGKSTSLLGADTRAGDLRLDDLLAPELLSPTFRQLLGRAGDALEVAAPLDLRALSVSALPTAHSTIHSLVQRLGTGMGFKSVQVLISPLIGGSCIPASSRPPVLIIGTPLLANVSEKTIAFLVIRALKLLQVGASTFIRASDVDLPVLFSAWLQTFNPNWKPPAIHPGTLAEVGRRIRAAMPRGLESELGTIALEVAGLMLPQLPMLGPSVLAWGNRTALLAVGDPNAGLEAIAQDVGHPVPRESEARTEWIMRTEQARDLLAYSVSDAYNDARTQVLIGT